MALYESLTNDDLPDPIRVVLDVKMVGGDLFKLTAEPRISGSVDGSLSYHNPYWEPAEQRG